MSMIDRYSYSNRLRSVDPAYKASLALAMLLTCLLANRPAVGLLAAAWACVLAVVLARIPLRVMARLLLVELFFLVLASLGIAVSVQGLSAVPAVGWTVTLGPLTISTSPQMLATACTAVCRALGATAALNFLALTTPLVDLVALLRRLHVPALLIDLMTVTYRFIFILLETLDRIYTAQDCRLGYSSPRRSLISAGRLGSRLFIDAYRRSQRLQLALDARGFDGDLRVLPGVYGANPALLCAGLAAVASLVVVRVLL
jgi:cobalt/nickel transport system permease protein